MRNWDLDWKFVVKKTIAMWGCIGSGFSKTGRPSLGIPIIRIPLDMGSWKVPLRVEASRS